MTTMLVDPGWITINESNSFNQFVPRCYVDGEWQRCRPMVYTNGRWQEAGTTFHTMLAMDILPGPGDVSMAGAPYPDGAGTLYRDADRKYIMVRKE